MLLLSVWTLPANSLNLQEHPELKMIARDLISQDLYTQKELNDIFSKVVFLPKVVSAFERPAESLFWSQYRGLFITNKVVQNGVNFWKEHQRVLNKAVEVYGVPAEIICAIIGIETRYGDNKGSNPVINSLSTLSIHFERRKVFFQSELKRFLELSRQEGLDPLYTLGSYAGAMGIPQFIASSYQAYAVDFDNDGQRDLINSYADAIGSVANYLHLHGWELHSPVIADVLKINANKATKLLDSSKKAKFDIGQIKRAGVQIDGDFAISRKANLIKLQNKNGSQYQVVFENFYVIKKYNQSNLYAMAVAELGLAIKNSKQ